MDLCKDCIHQAVCARCAATGGHMLNCVHFIERWIQPDENGRIAVPKLPRVDDEIAVTLTREQWGSVQVCMKYSRDDNRNKAYWWEHCCADPKMAAENAALYMGNAENAVTILAAIEAALYPPEPQEETHGGD